MAIRSARRHGQRFRDFRNRHTDEIAKLDHLGGHGVFRRERVLGIVDRQDFRARSP